MDEDDQPTKVVTAGDLEDMKDSKKGESTSSMRISDAEFDEASSLFDNLFDQIDQEAPTEEESPPVENDSPPVEMNLEAVKSDDDDDVDLDLSSGESEGPSQEGTREFQFERCEEGGVALEDVEDDELDEATRVDPGVELTLEGMEGTDALEIEGQGGTIEVQTSGADGLDLDDDEGFSLEGTEGESSLSSTIPTEINVEELKVSSSTTEFSINTIDDDDDDDIEEELDKTRGAIKVKQSPIKVVKSSPELTDEEDDPSVGSFSIEGLGNEETITATSPESIIEEDEDEGEGGLTASTAIDDVNVDDFDDEATRVIASGDASESKSFESLSFVGGDPQNENLEEGEDEATRIITSDEVSEQTAQTRLVTPRPHDDEFRVFQQDELLRMNTTLKHLREDRERLLNRIDEFEKERIVFKEDNLSLRAEIDDLKIELSLLRKRYNDEMEGVNYNLKLAEDKKLMYEEKSKQFQKEFDKLNQQVRYDFTKIQQRERELESQLELLKADSESQISTRDNKILELKRKIDALEFNMENLTILEQKSKEDKFQLEDKMDKAMRTLRQTIGLLEDEELSKEPSEIIKKFKI
jgi:hypothetical protein